VTGTTIFNLSLESIRNAPIPLPRGIAEQDTVVDLINNRCRTIDPTREKIDTSVYRLREFRAALITAAVTGQIDVATWGKLGTTDRRLDEIEAEMAIAAPPEREKA